MFKVGIGPSSSHTMGPMVAAAPASSMPFAPRPSRRRGSARRSTARSPSPAWVTPRPRRDPRLAGFRPDTYDAEKAEAALARIREERAVTPPGLASLAFDPKADVIFDYGPPLPGHANGMILMATDAQGDVILQETYYSVGGGFVLTAEELAAGKDAGGGAPVPYPFRTAAEMLEMCAREKRSIAALKRANELTRMSAADLDRGSTASGR